jgi:hypothetical protein
MLNFCSTLVLSASIEGTKPLGSKASVDFTSLSLRLSSGSDAMEENGNPVAQIEAKKYKTVKNNNNMKCNNLVEKIKSKNSVPWESDYATTTGRSSSINPPYSLSEARTNYSIYNSIFCKYDRSWREEEESRRRFAFTNPEVFFVVGSIK